MSGNQQRRKTWTLIQVSTGVLVSSFSLSRETGISILFTSDFAIKTGQSDGKGLHSTHRVVVVQRKNVISYSAKLHHNVVHWEEKRKKKVQVKLQTFRDINVHNMSLIITFL